MNKIYPLPKELQERNALPRIINLDRSKGGGHVLFIQAAKVDDLSINKAKLYCYPLDVWDDGEKTGDILPFGFLPKSKAMIEKNTQIEMVVDIRNYIEFGDDMGSAWRFALILPSEPRRLPMSLYPLLSSVILSKNTDDHLETYYQKNLNRLYKKFSDDRKEEVGKYLEEYNEVVEMVKDEQGNQYYPRREQGQQPQ